MLQSFLIILTPFYDCREYSRLKEKYAGDLVRNWAESSDPEKSVHEELNHVLSFIT